MINMSQFLPASAFALKLGAKALVYGPPGRGKTPIGNTAPRPVMCAVEPGMLSMRASNIPTWGAFEPKRIDEFFEWLEKSNETKNFDTVIVDSLSQMAEIYLADELYKNKDPRKAYGELSRKMMKHMTLLYFLQNKHTYLICKQQKTDDNSVRPFFPGQDLNVKIPHLYDVILHLDVHNIPGAGQHKAFRTAASFDAIARDRSGRLSEFEPCDLTALFNKVIS